MVDLIREHTGLDLYAYQDATEARDAANAIGVATEPGVSWGQVVEAAFGAKVEHKLIQPTHFIYLPIERLGLDGRRSRNALRLSSMVGR
jgi:lysyl-tRNA synthetase, class II